MSNINYWREAEFDHKLKDGRVVSGKVKGRVLPQDHYIGQEVTDVTIDARCFNDFDDEVGKPVTMDDLAEDWESIEDIAIDALSNTGEKS